MSELIAELGDDNTKLRASGRLVEVAKDVNSDRWLKQKAPAVEAANKASKLSPTQAQFQQQLQQYQEEELLRVFSSMKRVGGTPIVDYLIAFAENTNTEPKRRAAALAALEGNLDRNNPRHGEAMLKLAGDTNTPDVVRDVALRRVGEMPRRVVINKLYELFKSDNWKVRWVAAELALKMSDTSHVEEFMARLREADGMAITEPLRYGALIGEMKGVAKPEGLAEKFAAKPHPVQARLSALGYFYEYGSKGDLPKLEPYSRDATKVPECKAGAQDCEWKCMIDQGTQKEEKDIKTVGDFVTYCVKPAMEKRNAPQTSGEKK
jgi:hypothetical protein